MYGDLDPFAEEEEVWDPLARFTSGILPNVTDEDVEDMLQDPLARWVVVLCKDPLTTLQGHMVGCTQSDA